jgi:aminocarboxymuconate-semialdehyde decarboxylase
MSFTVDVHQHILADAFWRATNDAHSPVGGILPAPWSKESTLSYMDEAGIDVAITSISTPGVHVGDDSAARDLARRVNELSAELMRTPESFGGFAALPLPDVDGALRALEYSLDVLRLDGVVTFLQRARHVSRRCAIQAPLRRTGKARSCRTQRRPQTPPPATSDCRIR